MRRCTAFCACVCMRTTQCAATSRVPVVGRTAADGAGEMCVGSSGKREAPVSRPGIAAQHRQPAVCLHSWPHRPDSPGATGGRRW